MIQQTPEPQLTEVQLAQLVGFGECFIHTHPKETLGFQDQLDLFNATPIIDVSNSPYTATNKDEIIAVDTTGGAITVILPLANKGREFQVIKVAGGNPVYVVPMSPDTVLGSTMGITFSGLYTSIHLKARVGIGYIPL